MLDTLRHRANLLAVDTEEPISTRRLRADTATTPEQPAHGNTGACCDSPASGGTPPARTGSGVPLGLVGWGKTKLAAVSEENLLMALQENGISLPALGPQDDTALWAREALLMKCVHVPLCLRVCSCVFASATPHMLAFPNK